jgi:hypothetical protein
VLFGETVAVYCENHTECTDTVPTSQQTHYVSATEPNRLVLFGETVAVYCENHTEHRDTVPTLQETHYFSATKSNRLVLFGETVAVYCENHTEHTDTASTSHYVFPSSFSFLFSCPELSSSYKKDRGEGVMKEGTAVRSADHHGYLADCRQ